MHGSTRPRKKEVSDDRTEFYFVNWNKSFRQRSHYQNGQCNKDQCCYWHPPDRTLYKSGKCKDAQSWYFVHNGQTRPISRDRKRSSSPIIAFYLCQQFTHSRAEKQASRNGMQSNIACPSKRIRRRSRTRALVKFRVTLSKEAAVQAELREMTFNIPIRRRSINGHLIGMSVEKNSAHIENGCCIKRFQKNK